MTNLFDKIEEEIINEAGTAHDTTKDMFRKNFNAIYSDMFNKKIDYFTRDNCIFHHINGEHSLDNIANVLLIRSDNSRDCATAAHMLIHMHALLVRLAKMENSVIDLRFFNFDFADLKNVSLWTFKAPAGFTGTGENDFLELIDYMQNLDNNKEDKDKITKVIKRRNGNTYTRLKTQDSYNNQFKLECWTFKQYLDTFGNLLASADSTKNFLSGIITEKFNNKILFRKELKETMKKIKEYGQLNKTINEGYHSYYNKVMDLSHAIENKKECIELIKDNYGYNGPVSTGGYYILPDGSVVKSTNHADIDKLLIKQNFIIPKEGYTKKDLLDNFEYGDGSQFLEAIGAVRLRRRGGADSWMLPYLTMSNIRPTTAQLEIMIDWLDFVLKASGEVMVIAPSNYDGVINAEHVYKRSLGDTADDIIDDIKHFYITKSLPEDLTIDYTVDEEILEKDLEKGYFGQF